MKVFNRKKFITGKNSLRTGTTQRGGGRGGDSFQLYVAFLGSKPVPIIILEFMKKK